MAEHFRRLTTSSCEMNNKISFLYGCQYYKINKIEESKKETFRTHVFKNIHFVIIPIMSLRIFSNLTYRKEKEVFLYSVDILFASKQNLE